MNFEERQQELFTEYGEGESKKRNFVKGLIPERTIAVSFSYEKFIVGAIVCVVLLAVIFAVGFECGRSSAFTKNRISHIPTPAGSPEVIMPMQPKNQIAANQQRFMAQPVFVKNQTPIPLKAQGSSKQTGRPVSLQTQQGVYGQTIKRQAPPLQQPSRTVNIADSRMKPYTIQVATFRSKEFAQQEIAGLRAKGFATTLAGINGLYEVWVGNYSDMNEANRALNILRRIYRDCRIKKK